MAVPPGENALAVVVPAEANLPNNNPPLFSAADFLDPLRSPDGPPHSLTVEDFVSRPDEFVLSGEFK
jgi:hypothetical protein